MTKLAQVCVKCDNFLFEIRTISENVCFWNLTRPDKYRTIRIRTNQRISCILKSLTYLEQISFSIIYTLKQSKSKQAGRICCFSKWNAPFVLNFVKTFHIDFTMLYFMWNSFETGYLSSNCSLISWGFPATAIERMKTTSVYNTSHSTSMYFIKINPRIKGALIAWVPRTDLSLILCPLMVSLIFFQWTETYHNTVLCSA